MSHTKGPWYVGAMNDALFIIDRPPAHFTDNGVREGGDTNVIASIRILDHRADEANARLIAKAPHRFCDEHAVRNYEKGDCPDCLKAEIQRLRSWSQSGIAYTEKLEQELNQAKQTLATIASIAKATEAQ